MLILGTFLLLAVTSATAQDLISQSFSKRSVVSTGGFAYNKADSATCPNGSYVTSENLCCPNGLTYEGNYDDIPSGYCCPQGGQDCGNALDALPFCADTIWNLWNATYQGQEFGYFCCLDGQVGTNDGDCDVGGTPLVPSLRAVLIASGTVTLAPGETVAISTTSAPGSEITSMPKSTVTGTAAASQATGGGGIGGILSKATSEIGVATSIYAAATSVAGKSDGVVSADAGGLTFEIVMMNILAMAFMI